MISGPYLQVLGFDVGASKIAGGIVAYPFASQSDGVYVLDTGAPRVLAYSTTPTNSYEGGEAVLTSLASYIRSYIDEDRGPLVGVGVASTGIVDPASGSIGYANELMPGWTGQPLKAYLEDQLELPIAVLGDVQGHALGEVRWGAARGTHSSICVGVGTGLGGAFSVDGNVLLGMHGASGHIGHVLHPQTAHMMCACGRQGHLEALASGTGLSAYYQGLTFGDLLDPARLGDHVVRQAEAGEQRAIETLELAGFVLGESIGGWCNMFDPEVVVLSGSVCQAGQVWLDAVKRGFASQVIHVLQDIPLVFAELGAHAPLVGAAEFLLDGLVDQGIVERPVS